jgi:hypothetical protein
MSGIVASTTVMMSPWLREQDRGSAELRRAAVDYVQLAEIAKSGGQRDWAVASCQRRRKNVPDGGVIVYQSG